MTPFFRFLLAGLLPLVFAVAGCQRGPSAGEDTVAAPEPAPAAHPADDVASRAVVSGEITAAPADQVAARIRALTGGRTRLVWVQDIGDGTNVFAERPSLVLMGLDTDDGRGERAILAAPASYVKPQITPAGDRVVYTDRTDGRVYVVDWDGGNLERVTEGFALALWPDPRDGREWVYVGTDLADVGVASYSTVRRHLLDRPEVAEPIWVPGPVSIDSFQISRDGLRAGGNFPWPEVGVSHLDGREWHHLGQGCWTAMAPDNSYTLWYFDGAHRNVTMVDTKTGGSWRVNINDAPGIDGFEVYHPRWSNHPRILAMTGPYRAGGGDNRIRGGGEAVEIHLGRFSPDYTRVERWEQATDNDRADFFPDVWVAPEAWRTAGPVGSPAPARSDAAAPAAPLVVEARLVELTRMPTPRAIEPYRHALVAHHYRVESVIEGDPPEEILAAHWVIRDGTVIDGAARELNHVYRMTLVPYDDDPELEGERLVTDINRFDLRLYYEVER